LLIGPHRHKKNINETSAQISKHAWEIIMGNKELITDEQAYNMARLNRYEKKLFLKFWGKLGSKCCFSKRMLKNMKTNVIIRVNCLHRGNFLECTGKKYMICIDGSDSSLEAFQAVIKLMNPTIDHLFIVCGKL
jgi:hypothetical protein